MLFYDVNNGIARRAWARNSEAMIAIGRELKRSPALRVTQAEIASDSLVEDTIAQVF
jgi:urocanate hydratase